MLRRRWKEAVAAGKKAVQEAEVTAGAVKPRTPGQRVALIYLGRSDGFDAAVSRHLELGAIRQSDLIVASNTITQKLILMPDVIFEFLPLDIPPPVRVADPQGESVRYLLDRVTHVVTFWNVQWCIWTGERAQEMYHEARTHAPALASMGAPERQES